MDLMLKSVAALAVSAAIAVGTAGANGSVYSPGLAYAWPGVAGRDGVHYVTLGPSKWTVVAAIRGKDGRVLRTRGIRGFYAVPLVAYNGVAGGLSGDGRSLVLASYGPFPGRPGRTRFAVVSTRTLEVRRTIVLDGAWSFDAVSPDARALFLTEHVRAGDNPLYRIRPFDVRTGRLGDAVVDRLEGEGEMTGAPVARAASAEGRWAYTLYARRDHEPFVHALDTAKGEAFCIDLPLDLPYDRQWSLRLRLGQGGRVLSVSHGRQAVATVHTRSWDVRARG
jgi:hypothetical protein